MILGMKYSNYLDAFYFSLGLIEKVHCQYFWATFLEAQHYQPIILWQPEVTPRQMCGLELLGDDGGGVILMIILVRDSTELHFALLQMQKSLCTWKRQN